MDGHTLARSTREGLHESSAGTFMNSRTTYDYLYAGAIAFNMRAHLLVSSQTITVVQGTTSYNLNSDFAGMANEDSAGREFIKFTVNSADYFIYPMDYSQSVLGNSTAQGAIPIGYYILKATPPSNVTGTATSTGVLSNGETTLTDSNASYTTVAVGDLIHNTTDDSHGVVVSVTNSTTIICSLFEGTTNQFTSGDAYIIIPQARFKLVIDPAPSQSATISFNYAQRPNPVYSPYRAYNYPFEYVNVLVNYAVACYKAKDRDFATSQAIMGLADKQIRDTAAQLRRSLPQRNNFRLDLMGKGNRGNPHQQWGRR